MSNVQRLADLEVKLTMIEDTYSPGAKIAFDELYTNYGLPGIEALIAAGHDDPVKVWDFYLACYRSVSEMARRLNLK